MDVKTKIIAHRGYSQKYPENTLIAFKKAKELNADGIELDIHMTKDAKLMVHHDYYLGNTDNGRGMIFQRTFDYLKSLDCGSWFDKKFKGERMPSLQEVLKILGNIHYEIELKGFTIKFLNQLIKTIQIFKVLNQVEFTSLHLPLLMQLKSSYPKVKIGMLIMPSPVWMDRELEQTLIINNLKLGKFEVAHCPLSILDSNFINLLHKNRFLVHTANCNKKEEIEKAFKLKVDQLSTDNLEIALKLRYEAI